MTVRLVSRRFLMSSLVAGLPAAGFAADGSSSVLPAIEVTADEVEAAPVSESPLGVSFSGKEMTQVPGTGGDVLRAMDSLPGMVLGSDTDADPAIRGSRPENNLYYLDYMPTGYLFHYTGNSVVDGDLVERFDLYPAGYGAAWLGNIGGVVSVDTRAPSQTRRVALDVSLIEAGLSVEGQVRPSQTAFLSARMSYYDLILGDALKDEDEDVSIVQLPRFYDYRGKYLISLGQERKLTLMMDGAQDEVGFVINDASDQALQDPLVAGKYDIAQSYHRQVATLSQQVDSGAGWIAGVSHRFGAIDVAAGSVAQTKLDLDVTTLKAERRYVAPSTVQWRFGTELNRISADYDVSSRDPGCTEFEVDCRYSDAELLVSKRGLTVWQGKAFAENTLPLGARFSLVSGLGVHGDDYLGERWLEPRMRLDYAYNAMTTVSAAAGDYHELPDFAQVADVFGNPSLNYLASRHYVLGVEQDRPDGWFWKAEVYRKTFDQLVTGNDALRYDNDGRGKATGAELLLKRELQNNWSGWLAVSWSDVERTDAASGESFAFEFDQPWIASLVARRELNARWSVSGKLRYHSGGPYTPILGGEANDDGSYSAVYGAINSERLPDYLRLDLRFDYQRSPASVMYYAELINATANTNVSGYDYNADYSERSDIEQLPLFLYFGVKKVW